MIQQQLVQIVFWLGVLVCLPTFYRFVYAGSSLLWRRLFPTRVVEIRFLDSTHKIENTVTIQLDRKDGKKIVDLIEEATLEDNAKK
ncbi:TPA: hypothetical protein ME601_004212 [Klebsiella pneumoniae]|nr:hypothetical protein [Klebsiella pneumoniae]HBW4866624.1 hypothetical protein [Klebsiella pneumoniae]HBW4877740.1 hypothetical protein [Klebsiella pneumoniae]HBW5039272.1 hypothetical protein [Klebsiella pneumoniae]HBW5066553.1 hypothetical protein [Klebsiella pneumoniae]